MLGRQGVDLQQDMESLRRLTLKEFLGKFEEEDTL